MRLANSRGPGRSRLALILIGCGLLAGCASARSSEPPPEARAGGWRVVERLGEARYLAPDASGWSPATPASMLPSGSEVTTGAGGRVILARAGDHISVGPTSRLSLPSGEAGGVLRQDAGWLRYRVAETTADPLVVATPFLEIEVRGTIFDVTVSPLATEVAVERGQVRIATPDGLRQIELEAGQSAYAGGTTGGLAFRRGPGEPMEQVETIVLPAMHPTSDPIEGRSPGGPLMVEATAAHRASTSGAAASQAAVPIATATVTALPAGPATVARAVPPAGASGRIEDSRWGSRARARRSGDRGVCRRAGGGQGWPARGPIRAARRTVRSPDRGHDRFGSGRAAPLRPRHVMRARSELSSALRRAPGRRGGGRRRRCGLIASGVAGWLAACALCGGPGPALADLSARSAAPPPAAVGALDTSPAVTEGDWVVLRAAADASWRREGGVGWLPIASGQVLPAGSEVETGPAGALLLVVGGDRLVVAADSRVVLPARDPGQDQRLRIERGRMRVDVEPRPGRDVEIRTPLLSLGIKGTSLEVAVDPAQDSVLVLEGRITVTTPDHRAVADLGAGEGLRQPTEPGSVPERLAVPDLPASVERNAPLRWYLEVPGAASASDASSVAGPVGSAEAAPATVERAPRTAAGRSRPTGGRRDGWLDDRTSMMTIVLIAAAGLMILIMPGMALGQNIRQQWRDRSSARGRRRRGLTQG